MLGIDERALRVVWTIFLFALLLAVLYYIRDTILVFSAAIFFAYMLSPIVGLVERFLPARRTLALTIVYILLIGALTGIGFAVIPTIAEEATSLVTRLPSLLTGGNLMKFPLPQWLEPMRAQLIIALNKEATNLESSVVPFIQQTGTRILSGLGYLLPMILVPILAFFFLKDGRDIRTSLIGAVEAGQDRTTIELIIDDVHLVLKNYIRALVLLAIASFVAWAIFLSVLRYPYEALLAGLAGVCEFIPVFGPAAALAIMLIVFGVTGSGGLLWIILFWGCYRIFQDYILNPYLMSAGVELHALLVLFGVLAGERIAGVPGMFFSIPVIAILKVIYAHLRTSYTRKQLAPA
ncbi:MAG: AI-2E family transporter [Acidobacteriaceae bacterium]|nr:AI-2E family transporter [Acidobacteriaceae bacterium]